MTIIRVGDVFEVKGGSVTILEYRNKDNVLVRHNDKHGHEMWTLASSLKKGMVKNPYLPSVEGVGYLGVGKFKCYVDGKITEEYSVWRSMLVRCYKDSFLLKNPTYNGCTVCEEWLNFQNFAYWYTREDEYGRGYTLDKDILSVGSKIYSPKTCCLVPQSINSFFSMLQCKEGDLSRGVKNTKSGRFSSKISIMGKSKSLGVFDTKVEAEEVYKRAKGIRAKELALDNIGNMRYKVFLAIMDWEF